MTRASLTVDECYDFSNLLEAKYIARADELAPALVTADSLVIAERLAHHLSELRNRPDENRPLRDSCVFCNGLLMEDRVTVDTGRIPWVQRPCWFCRPRAFTAYHAMIARHEESQEPAPATLRTACNWCGSAECQAPVDHMVQLCGSDARWSLECAACHKCLTGGASYVALGVFAEHHEAHGLACRWASPEFHSNRDGWDEHDDRRDIQPFESTTTYPWGRHGDD